MIVIRMVTTVRRGRDGLNETCKDYIKKTHSELKNSITEIENTVEEIRSRLVDAEERISNLENRLVEITP